MKKYIVILLFTIFSTSQAFADKASDYKDFASRVRAEVWADSLPLFDNPPAVPDKYKDESAVILTAHKNVFAKKKTGVGFDRNASLIPLKRVALINMDDYDRKLIQINDKSALEAFSEYDLPIKSGNSDWFWQEKDERSYVLGVRIIKPDGKIVEVPTDEFILMQMQQKNKKADRQKLAVPGLEIGDKLDIFIFTHTALKNIQPEPIIIPLRSEYPILSYTVNCKIDDDLTTVYSERNGAFALKTEQGPDKDYIITGETTTPQDAEPENCYRPRLQSPHIEMLIYNRRFDEYTPIFARKDGVQANPDGMKTAVADRIKMLEGWSDMSRSVKEQLGSVKGNPMKAVKKKYTSGEWTQAQTADYVYNLLVFSYLTGRYRYYAGTFVNELYAALQQAGIKDVRKGIITSCNNGELEDIIDYKDIYYFIYLPETEQFFSNAFLGYNTSSEILPFFQGQKGLLTHNKKLSKNERESEDRRITVPQSSPEDNRVVTTINAAVDGLNMNVTTQIDVFGASKNKYGLILTGENILNGYLSYLNREGIVADPQLLRKEKDKDKQARMERYADAAKEQREQMQQLLKDYHGADVNNFEKLEVLSSGIGITPDSSAISIKADYSLDGLVKRAGKNLIVNVGQLTNRYSEIPPSKSKRLPGDNVMLEYPSLDETIINLKLPEGYMVSATSLASLNSETTNDAVSFISKAEVKDGYLKLHTLYRHNKTSLPAQAWTDMVTVRNEVAKFNSKTLLLEKN